jgi:LemA protein
MVLLLALFIVFCTSAVLIYNRLVKYRFFVREAQSGMDVQLKRRHDLLPKLVEVVKGYSKYESTLMKNVTEIRSRLEGAQAIKDKGKVETEVSAVFKNIFALAENYPDLKANQNFLDLQKTISEVEDQIQLSRRYYNGTVRDFNIMAETFPSNLVAAAFNFKPEEFFEFEYATERQNPEPDFNEGKPS